MRTQESKAKSQSYVYALKRRLNRAVNKAWSKTVMGWEEVAPSAIMDWAGFEFASSVFRR